MPIDDVSLLGSESDGSPNPDYCKYCYQGGQFTHPATTLAEMKAHMMKLSDSEKLPEAIRKAAINRLPTLKRWRVPSPGKGTRADK